LDLAASQQAFFCYNVLRLSYHYENAFNLVQATFKHGDLAPTEKQNTADLATESFTHLCTIDDFKREAERILVGLGLPSTWDEFSAYNGNRCRIQINLDVAKPASEDFFESLVTRFYYMTPFTDDEP
jgi:hypothetical protein